MENKQKEIKHVESNRKRSKNIYQTKNKKKLIELKKIEIRPKKTKEKKSN